MTDRTKSIPARLRAALLERLLPIAGDDYQRQRFPDDKVNTILSGIDLDRVGSVLDVGCNEGMITSHFTQRGRFAVGIDVSPFFARNFLRRLHDSNTPAFGNMKLGPDNVSTLPTFDLVLVLSVHHWWVKEHGDDAAKRMVRSLIERARHYFVIEFSSIREKYGYVEPQFVDNDAASVTAYARRWLLDTDPACDVRYLGPNAETQGREKQRHIFLVQRQPAANQA
jgi:SAM-dependent methyltransferase